ncbi:RNA-splicing ligase RtcB [Candidatus Pacearchaeota archaeon]|nr:RNA-splicing ligase RtcB [Candidatus Pacearchaeota archaeon]
MTIEVKKVSKNIYEIPKTSGMKVPGIVYASKKLIEKMKQDKSLEQVMNVAHLPGIIDKSIGLADAHQGYGFPIGGVAAFDMDSGVISPGGVGYDINCSVRLLKTNLTKQDILKKQKEVADQLSRKIPSGVGRGSNFQISKDKFKKVLEKGVPFIVEEGYGKKEDYKHMEEEGCLKGADSSKVSKRAMKRGLGQLGTLGAGNHFLDVHYVDEIFDEKVANAFGLKKDQVTIMIHCGSRGFGHQVASDYIKAMENEYGFKDLPDRELINAPIKSKLGQDYYNAMACAVNFAFVNKQIITHWVREEMKYMFPDVKIDVVYDVCHNIAKFEEFEINGKMQKVCVHRKGATRSFGPGRKEIPLAYRKVGQPVFIPGSMGTPSYVLVGTKKSEELTWGSSVHGAGRKKSRNKAMKEMSGEEVKEMMKKKGIELRASGGYKLISQEAPYAYKDIEDVVDVVHDLDISKRVARLKPMVVCIG